MCICIGRGPLIVDSKERPLLFWRGCLVWGPFRAKGCTITGIDVYIA